MINETNCPKCGGPLPSADSVCDACGDPLASASEVVVEPLEQEARVAYGLLESAGLHPSLAYHDEADRPHLIEADEALTGGAGFMIPVNTSFGVFVPSDEVDDARRILEDARGAAREQAEN